MRAGKAEQIISVAMYEDEWRELIKFLNATLDALAPEDPEFITFKATIGHIENQTSIRTKLRRCEFLDGYNEYESCNDGMSEMPTGGVIWECHSNGPESSEQCCYENDNSVECPIKPAPDSLQGGQA